MEKAFSLFEKASSMNETHSMNNLALFYKNGIHVEKDLKKSFELFYKAAELGNMFAMYNIAVFYYRKF